MAAKPIILGKITVAVAGTPVQLIASTPFRALNTRFYGYHAALLQALPTNTGLVYIGGVGMNKTTLAVVSNVLAIPSTSSIPSFGVANLLSPAGVDLSAFWLDAAVSGEGVLVTLLET